MIMTRGRGIAKIFKLYQFLILMSVLCIFASQLEWITYRMRKDECTIVEGEILYVYSEHVASGSSMFTETQRLSMVKTEKYGQYPIDASLTDRTSKKIKVAVYPNGRMVRPAPRVLTPSDSGDMAYYLLWLWTIAAVLLRIFRPDFMAEIKGWLLDRGMKV